MIELIEEKCSFNVFNIIRFIRVRYTLNYFKFQIIITVYYIIYMGFSVYSSEREKSTFKNVTFKNFKKTRRLYDYFTYERNLKFSMIVVTRVNNIILFIPDVKYY